MDIYSHTVKTYRAGQMITVSKDVLKEVLSDNIFYALLQEREKCSGVYTVVVHENSIMAEGYITYISDEGWLRLNMKYSSDESKKIKMLAAGFIFELCAAAEEIDDPIPTTVNEYDSGASPDEADEYKLDQHVTDFLV